MATNFNLTDFVVIAPPLPPTHSHPPIGLIFLEILRPVGVPLAGPGQPGPSNVLVFATLPQPRKLTVEVGLAKVVAKVKRE